MPVVGELGLLRNNATTIDESVRTPANLLYILAAKPAFYHTPVGASQSAIAAASVTRVGNLWRVSLTAAQTNYERFTISWELLDLGLAVVVPGSTTYSTYTADNSLATLATNLAALTTTVNGINTNVNSVLSGTSANTTTLAAIQSGITALSTTANTISSNVLALAAQAASNQSATVANQSVILSAVQGNATALTVALTDLSTIRGGLETILTWAPTVASRDETQTMIDSIATAEMQIKSDLEKLTEILRAYNKKHWRRNKYPGA